MHGIQEVGQLAQTFGVCSFAGWALQCQPQIISFHYFNFKIKDNIYIYIYLTLFMNWCQPTSPVSHLCLGPGFTCQVYSPADLCPGPDFSRKYLLLEGCHTWKPAQQDSSGSLFWYLIYVLSPCNYITVITPEWRYHLLFSCPPLNCAFLKILSQLFLASLVPGI